MRTKSWPYWEHWQVIFGKDRASGTIAEDVLEAIHDEDAHDDILGSGIGAGNSQNLEDIGSSEPLAGTHSPEGATDSNSQSTRVKGGSSLGGKKRKIDHGIDGLIELLGRLHDDTNARLDRLSLRIGYNFDLSKARKEVYEVLGTVPGLSREQKFDASEIILEKVERLDFFLGIPEVDRLAYVIRVLAKYG